MIAKFAVEYDLDENPGFATSLKDFGQDVSLLLSFFIYKMRMRSASQGSYEDYQDATCYTRDGIRSLFTLALLPRGTLSPVRSVTVSLPTPPCSAAEGGISSASMPQLSSCHLLSGATDQESLPGRAVCSVIAFI